MIAIIKLLLASSMLLSNQIIAEVSDYQNNVGYKSYQIQRTNLIIKNMNSAEKQKLVEDYCQQKDLGYLAEDEDLYDYVTKVYGDSWLPNK